MSFGIAEVNRIYVNPQHPYCQGGNGNVKMIRMSDVSDEPMVFGIDEIKCETPENL